ncbi:MAG: hypothetical protein Tsb002_08260 [Wenzhouxiangellaceae bacterium]
MNKNLCIVLLIAITESCSASGEKNKEFNINKYLSEAKLCFQPENISRVKEFQVPERIAIHLTELDESDYVDHIALNTDELLIHFKKNIESEDFFFDMSFNLNQKAGCERLSVYEVMQ